MVMKSVTSLPTPPKPTNPTGSIAMSRHRVPKYTHIFTFRINFWRDGTLHQLDMSVEENEWQAAKKRAIELSDIDPFDIYNILCIKTVAKK